MGTTVRVASMRDDGQTFHESLTPNHVNLEKFFGSWRGRVLTISFLNVLEIKHLRMKVCDLKGGKR